MNALLDFVIAHYATDGKRLQSRATAWEALAPGIWQRMPGTLQRSDSNCQPAAGWRLPVLAIHSRDDQVAPFDPAAARIAELQKAGVNAKLIALTNMAHYEIFRFRDALRQAVPWLREVWK